MLLATALNSVLPTRAASPEKGYLVAMGSSQAMFLALNRNPSGNMTNFLREPQVGEKEPYDDNPRERNGSGLVCCIFQLSAAQKHQDNALGLQMNSQLRKAPESIAGVPSGQTNSALASAIVSSCTSQSTPATKGDGRNNAVTHAPSYGFHVDTRVCYAARFFGIGARDR